MLLGLATVAGTVVLLEAAIARPRPPTALLVNGPTWDYAFPSGHTADGTVTWVLATILLTVGLDRRIRGIAMIGACLVCAAIGLSRVYLGYHWVTDVISGWLIAITVICLMLQLGRQIDAFALIDGSGDTGGSWQR
ncbi:phosphatase PAP2 family protein [Microlunatus ginsengisoli]|uniref:phosphatase PAP2 family protein n=1 Tax=Microlunatus ginsengisoli TaxID=363863 RepID=UPI003CD05A40